MAPPGSLSAQAPALAATLAAALLSTGCVDPAPPADSAPAASSATPAAPAAAPLVARPQLDGRDFPDKVLALTWDDGPDAHTFELAQYLHAENVSATFFVVADWVDGVSADPGAGTGVFATGHENIPLLADLVALGHRLGNHTLNHVLLDDSDAAAVEYQLGENQARLDPYITNELRLFRVPGGAWNAEASGAVGADPVAGRLVGPIRWDVDAKDWEGSLYCRSTRPLVECERAAPGEGGGLALRVKPAVIARRYLAAVESAGHGVVLMHDRVGHVGSRYALDIAQILIPELKARGYVFAAPVLQFSRLSARGRVNPGDFAGAATLRLADLDGDGRDDACARTPLGVVCAASRQLSSGRGSPEAVLGVPSAWDRDLADAAGWSPPEHGDTLQLADVDGDGRADLCARGPEGIACALADLSRRFGTLQGWSASHRVGTEDIADFSDAEGWGSDPGYWGTLRFADLDGDGKADVCGRSPAGVVCARSLGNGFERTRLWLADLTDAQGWLSPEYATTLQLGDVNGDGRADLCGRSRSGLVCALSQGTHFGKARLWSAGTDFADADPYAWARDPGYYETLRLGDLNGDGRADVCGRSRDGLVCALSTGHAFTRATLWLGADLGDASGWLSARAAASIQLGDLNGDGRADVCALGADGVVCGLAP